MLMYNLCIVKPNKSAFSETFVQEHINRLSGNKKVIYGGAFPLYDHTGALLIRSKFGILQYLIRKRIFKQTSIGVRTKALAKYLKAEKIDVVFAEYGMVGGLITAACKFAGVPLVVHFHGADAHHRPTVNKYRSFYQELFQYASSLIAVSHDMEEALVNLGAPRERIAYIPCGVDIDTFTPVRIDSESKNFLSVGRFVEKKSPLLVVKAFEMVVRKVPESRLFMVGAGPLFTKVKQYVQENGLSDCVKLTGALDQQKVRELMKDTRCFIQHSVTASDGDMEGSPLTIVEASAAGLPIVSTCHAGIKESVVDGVTGFLVAERDTSAMAEKMVQIAQSVQLARQMGSAGRQHITKNYNITTQIEKLDKEIMSAVSKNRI